MTSLGLLGQLTALVVSLEPAMQAELTQFLSELELILKDATLSEIKQLVESHKFSKRYFANLFSCINSGGVAASTGINTN
jgi:hypothetical protein